MTIEHPRFPTPEDERCAAQLFEAMRILAEIVKDSPFAGAPDLEKLSGTRSSDRVGE